MAGGGPKTNQQSLADAVARNAGSVMSVPAAGLIRHFKSRFVGESEEGLWLEMVPEAVPLVSDLIQSRRPLAISFKSHEMRLSFGTLPVCIEPHFQINMSTTISAVLVRHPAEVKGIQRRAAYRVKITAEAALFLRLWAIPEHVQVSDRPMAAQEIKARMRDLSIGGMGINILPSDREPRKLLGGQRLRAELKFGELELILEGRLRLGPAVGTSGEIAAGVAFQKLESDVDGRKKLAALTRIVGHLHRDEVRRAHLGMAA